MSTKTKVTLHKGGTGERTIFIDAVQIPDLWHVAELLREEGETIAADQVIECWSLTHDLKRHIAES